MFIMFIILRIYRLLLRIITILIILNYNQSVYHNIVNYSFVYFDYVLQIYFTRHQFIYLHK